MSMMSDRLMPSGCEVDVTGVVSMVALQLASGQPSALVDWNNNYAGERDKCILFHCGNWARSFFPEARMANAEILATVLGTENTYGTVSGRATPGPMTYARITTDDRRGCIRTYVGEGRITGDPLDTFGSRAVVEIPNLQKLMRYVCKNGYERSKRIWGGKSTGTNERLPESHRLQEQRPQVIRAGGARGELGDPVLGQRALHQPVHIGRGIPHSAEPVRHAGAPHQLRDRPGEEVAGALRPCRADVGSHETRRIEMTARVRLGGETEDGRSIEDDRHAVRHDGMIGWVALGNVVPDHAGYRVGHAVRQVDAGVSKAHPREGGG
jgi:hypothetical protein